MPDSPRSNFLADIIAADVEAGTYGGRVRTRFPPEPNGYPHIGHAQSICLNFGLAERFGGTTNLRFDDTNPETESEEFARALEDAVCWLGFEPAAVLYASDYFEQLYEWAQALVRKGLAYVDSQDEDAIRAGRGTVTEPGTPSPFRDRPAEESLRLLDEMRRGEHPDGAHVLRARIDTAHGPMADPNMKLRDPIMYRIRRDAHHYRRGREWAIYPLYDWAHGQEDAIEGVTHSICTLEFDVNRPLYDWYLDALGIPAPRNRQYEFARFNLDHTVMSKRTLRRLVEEGHVSGWDDPRMPTLAGMRRRGVRPEALRRFFADLGVTKVNGSVEIQQLDYAVRDDLNGVAPRVLAVTDPVPLTLTNLDAPVTVEAPLWPHDVDPPAGAPRARALTLGPELWVERGDVSLEPPRGWRRLAPDAEVRLRHGYVVRVTGIQTDAAGDVTGVTATADLATLDAEPAGRRVRGVIHWADRATARPATMRLYEPLFTVPDPSAAGDVTDVLNPDSLVETAGWVEPSVAGDPGSGPGQAETRYQFERLGYFWRDADSAPGALVFNRIVALRDSWSKRMAAQDAGRVPLDAEPPRPVSAAPAASAQPSVSQRDPASSLTSSQKPRYDALVAAGVGPEEAAVVAGEATLDALYDAVTAAGGAPREAAVLLVHDLRPALHSGASVSQEGVPALGAPLADVLARVDAGQLVRAAQGAVARHLVAEGGTAAEAAEALGLGAVGDDALAAAVDAALAAHPDEVARLRAGEARLLGFLTGQAMRRAGRGADAKRVQALLRERLGA